MEEWQLDFEWLKVRHFVKASMNQDELPDLQIILLLIGIQESNVVRSKYTKEEKQDLMHVATCHLLSVDGYYELEGIDDEGWPHYKLVRMIPVEGEKAQEQLLKESIINYFNSENNDNILFNEN